MQIINQKPLQMPLYQSHKKVHALQIKAVVPRATFGATLHFVEPGFTPIEIMDGAMFVRYQPVAGDYYVVYDDRYASFSPKKVFEEGYTRI